MENRALAAVINLVDISGLLSLSEVLKYRLAEECLALFNVNGTFRKTSLAAVWGNTVVQHPTLWIQMVRAIQFSCT